MSVSLPDIRQGVRYHFFSHFFAFVLVIGRAWKTKHTQQWKFLASRAETPVSHLFGYLDKENVIKFEKCAKM